MMSAANVMAIGIKQADAVSVSPDPSEVDVGAFAQSFDEGVKANAASQIWSFAGQAIAPMSMNISGCTKGQVESAKMPDGSKDKRTGDRTTLPGELASPNMALKPVRAASPGRGSYVGAGLNATEDQVRLLEFDVTADKLSPDITGKLLARASTGDLTGDVSGEKTSTAHRDATAACRLECGRGNMTVHKGKVVANKIEPPVSIRKAVKTQQQQGAEGGVQKTAVSALNASGDSTASVIVPTEPIEIRVTGPSNGSLQDGMASAANVDCIEAGVMVSHAGTGIVAVTHKAASGTENTTDAKSSMPEVLVSPDQVASGSPGEIAEKATGAVTSTAAEIENRVQGAHGSTTAIVTAVTNAGLGPETSVLSVAHSHPIAGFASQKTPAGEDGAHGPRLQTGVEERKGLEDTGHWMNTSPRMLMATPTAIEVGVQDGTHGWLKVRAEISDGGTVNASVSAASSAGQEALHRELPALTAYLQDEKIAVAAVVIHAPVQASAAYRNSADAVMGGGQAQQGSNEGGGQREQGAGRFMQNRIEHGVRYQGSERDVDDGLLTAVAYAGGGSWLNVRV